LEPAFILHSRRYQESSLIVQVLTESKGRFAAVARGALRKRSSLSGLLQPLSLLAIEVKGRSSLLSLTHADVVEIFEIQEPKNLYAVFYMNELIMNLTVEHDECAGIFRLYRNCLKQISDSKTLEPVLRQFEVSLLQEIGLGMNLTEEYSDGSLVEGHTTYIYVPDKGCTSDANAVGGVEVSGNVLLWLSGKTSYTVEIAKDAKKLMRYVLAFHLGGKEIKSRSFFQEMNQQEEKI
jgi:DNA repair protein RecO (recombination protein O)